MPSTRIETEVKLPKPSEMELARETSLKLLPHLRRGEDLHFQIRDGGSTEELVLPSHAAKMLLEMLVEMGFGNAVQITSLQPEISTQQAADLLNVTRPYIVKLTEEGAIPSRKIGPRQLLMLDDVVAYKKQMYKQRLDALNELTALSQELGLYDDEAKQ